MLSIIAQSFGVPSKAISTMLGTIQDMNFYLQTGFGDLEGHVGGSSGDALDPIKTQGIMQGNGGGPSCWAVTTIPLLKAHKRKGHGAHLVASISDKKGHIAGCLFVDDDDKIHLKMNAVETKLQAFEGLQQSIINWGKLLIATGGALKPDKCSYSLVSFRWKKEGTWAYEDNESDNMWDMVVGEFERIQHLSVNEAVKTLG